MSKPDIKAELDALLTAAEKNRAELRRSWRKVEELEAAIQAAQRVTEESKEIRNKRKGR